jgi:hypothetical protein
MAAQKKSQVNNEEDEFDAMFEEATVTTSDAPK